MASNEKKRDVVRRLLLANPARSDRDIASEAGYSANMVGRVRLELQGNNRIPEVVKRRGLDGRERKKRSTDEEIRKAKPEFPPKRGRRASPCTELIRAMLDDTDGIITFRQAIPIFKVFRCDVSQNTFNVTKNRWKEAKGRKN